MVSLLLENHADPNTPLILQRKNFAGGYGPGAVRFGGGALLGPHKYIESKQGFTPLLMATAEGQKETAQILLDHKADVNAKDVSSKTPLLIAGLQKDKDMVELLLAHKADVNWKDDQGWTALLVAVSKDDREISDVAAEQQV